MASSAYAGEMRQRGSEWGSEKGQLAGILPPAVGSRAGLQSTEVFWHSIDSRQPLLAPEIVFADL